MSFLSGLGIGGIILAIIVGILLIAFVGVYIGGLLIEYTLEYWVSQIKGEPVDIPKLPCCVAGVFIGWNIGIPAAIITWITSTVWERPVAP